MSDCIHKDVLRGQQDPPRGKASNNSADFPGHEARMATHIQRVWNHACERTDGKRCRDCLYRRKR